MSSDPQDDKTALKRAKRKEQRNIVAPQLSAVKVGVERDYLRARDRYESAIAVLQTHTLWKHSDGRDLCDFDGEPYPCSTISALAFIYDVKIKELP